MKLWRKVSVAVLAACVLGAGGLAEVKTMDPITAQWREIGKHLKCPCGACAYSVTECNMMFCHGKEPVVEDMKELLAAGLSGDEVMSKILAKYGEQMRNEPQAEGFGAVGWAMPFAALAIGFIAAPFVVRRWRRNQQTAATAASQQVDSETLERFEAEIEKDLAREE